MASQRGRLIDEALNVHRDVFRQFEAATASEWLRLDLTMAQWKGLFALHQGGSMTIGGLAQILGIGLPAASVLVERLVHEGLAERSEDPADRRRAMVKVSADGEQLADRLRQGDRGRLREWLERMGEEDLAALVKGLRGMIEVGPRPSSSTNPAAPNDDARRKDSVAAK